jgi:hypothetical protein
MLTEIIIMAIVGVIVEAVKRAGIVNRCLPLVALIIGGLVAWGASFGGVTVESIFMGVLYGAATAGIYDFGKKTVLGK